MSNVQLDVEHPLALELASLREAASRYEHEAHAASVKLQRHTIDTSTTTEHNYALEQENTQLREELETLRGHPYNTPQSAALQVSELTLALRKLSDKLTLTEETLLQRTTQLAHAQSELGKAEQDRAAILAAARHESLRLEESEHRERELYRKARAAEEERKLADMALEEYAALVRKLEGRPSRNIEGDNAQLSPAANFAEGKAGLQRLLAELNTENEQAASDLSKARSENELLRTQLDAERQRSEADRESLAKIILELDKYRADDNSAAKMVSRYMKFSQSTAESLQKTMDDMRTRHASTISTLNLQIEHLHKALAAERRQTERLHEALDQLSEDVSREAYGRRREISLRLSFLGREEGLAESLRRWLRKSRETSDRVFSHIIDTENAVGVLRETTNNILHNAESLLETLNGQSVVDGHAPLGSVARIVAAQDAVNRLTQELQRETHLRVRAQALLGQAGINFEVPAPLNRLQELLLTPPESTSSVNLREGPTDPADATKLAKKTQHARVDETVKQPMAAVPEGSYPIGNPSREEKKVTAPTPTSAPTPTILVQTETAEVSPQSPVDPPSLPNASPIASEGRSEIPSTSPLLPVTELDPQVGEPELPVHLPTVFVTPVPEYAPPPSIDSVHVADEDKNQHPIAPTPPAYSSSDRPTVEEPCSTIPAEQVLSSSIQELSGLDIRELPSSSPHASPQLPDTAELPSTSSSTLNASLVIETRAGTPSSILFTPSPILPPSVHPLLPDLQITKQRYDAFQKAFRDCHLSLKDLKKDVAELPPVSEMTRVLKTAVERLNDFNEDTRVELEIRVSDEERIISGYETLLSVPGAMSDEVDEIELREEISAFIEGSTTSVAKALQQFSRKLDDLEHDIASIKRTLHELSSEELSPSPVTTATKSTSQGWTSWTGGILGGARPVSPAQTFGSVMTTPRARQSSFGAFMHRPSLPNLLERNVADSANSADRNNPFASLNLRIPMPAVVVPQSSPSPSRGMFLSPAPSGRPQKNRPAAPMYMLGLGMRGNSFGFGSAQSVVAAPSRLARSSEESGADSTEDDDGVATDSDVE